MSVSSDLHLQLRAALDEVVTTEIRTLQTLVPVGDELHHVLTTATAGGKLLRPTFCWWGWRAAGGSPTDRRIDRAAVALELLHAGALVHDDVLDASDTRRGQPTAHRRFAALHAAHGWSGSPDAYGTAGAVLAGDLLLAWADQVLRTSGLDAEALDRAGPVFDAMRVEVLAGQYLDIALQATAASSVEAAMQVVRLKSTRYTVQRPLQLGAVLAGADDACIAALAAYAEPLGDAFQLRDDLLGVFGDPGTTGKPAGDDIREGEQTVLVALATEGADEPQRAVLRRWIGAADLDPAGLRAVQEVMRDTGAVAACERLIDERAELGRHALEQVGEPAASALADLVDAATRRSS